MADFTVSYFYKKRNAKLSTGRLLHKKCNEVWLFRPDPSFGEEVQQVSEQLVVYSLFVLHAVSSKTNNEWFRVAK